MTDIAVLVVLGTSIWVAIDASRLKVAKGKLPGSFFDMSVTSWFLCCLLIWIVAFPAYLVKRDAYRNWKEPGGGTLSDIALLADLKDRGAITAEEFEEKKAAILKRF